MERTIESDLVKQKDNPKVFFEILFDVWRTERKNNEKALPEIVIDLQDKHNLDILKMALDAIHNDSNCFNIFHTIKDSIPIININIPALFFIYKLLYEKSKNDVFPDLYEPIIKLTEINSEIAKEILNILITHDEEFITNMIAIIYIELSKKDFSNILNDLIEKTKHKNIYVIQAAVFALGKINYKENTGSLFLTKTIVVLRNLFGTINKSIDLTIIQSYGMLLESEESLKNDILALSNHIDPDIKYHIARILFNQMDRMESENWFKDVLMNFTSTACEFKGINYIDMVLCHLVRKKMYPLFEMFLTSWIKDRDFNFSDLRIDKIYITAIDQLFLDTKEINRIVTLFLNNDDMIFHKVASDLISFISSHGDKNISLDPEQLKIMSYKDILFVSRKVLGYIYEVEVLNSLFFSILNENLEKEDINELILSIFITHIGKNYPGSTLEFLEEKYQNPDIKDRVKVLIRKIIKNLEKNIEITSSLPRLKELEIPRKKLYQVQLEINNVMNKAMEESRKESVFLNLCSRIYLKYGKGSFHFIDGKYSEISKLSEFKAEFEEAKMDVYHPISAAIERVNYRLAKRGE